MARKQVNRVNNKTEVCWYLLLAIFCCTCGNPTETGTPPPPMKEPVFAKEGMLQIYREDTSQILASIDIEIAESRAELSQGLMYRKRMADTQGMLFVFDQDAPRAFWMRNTFLSLDILYINSDMRIVSIYDRLIPLSDQSLPSKRPAQYVLEVVAGFCEKYSIKPGDRIRFERLNAT